MKKYSFERFIILCLAAGGLIIFALGCGPDTRYKVLSVFFTGVPTPEEKEEMRKMEELEKKLREEEKLAQLKKEAEDISPGEKATNSAPRLFNHKSYASGLCNDCHVTSLNLPTVRRGDSTRKFQRGGGRPGILLAPREKLCIRCHESLSPFNASTNGVWLHTAVAEGNWNACHDPHQSEIDSMLLDPPEIICLKCHAIKDILAINIHEKKDNCINCHNPHLGKDRLMLTKDYNEKSEAKLLPVIP